MRAMISTFIADMANARRDFPILQQQNRGKPLVYLDSSSSAQKPRAVIEAMTQFYSHDYANIHRGIYELSEHSTLRYEAARVAVKEFIHAASADEIIFVRGTTEGINLIAQCISQTWQAGDEVIISEMEHHSNMVPWLLLQKQKNIILKIIPINDAGELNLAKYQQLFSTRTKLVAVAHASNVLGTINPVKEMAAMAHAHGVPILLDGAQAVAHMPVNVVDINCDFYVFSAHKLYGPTGIGVLYGKKQLLNALPPYQGGGGMIETVSFTEVTFAAAPQKFEAGTPSIAEAIGLHAALQYVQTVGIENIFAHEQKLLAYAQEKLLAISGLRLFGTAEKKVGVMSFVLENIHPHDIGTVLDHEGVAIRAGHHCAMPLMKRFQVPAMVRASLGIYNNEQDIDALVAAIQLAKRIFQ